MPRVKRRVECFQSPFCAGLMSGLLAICCVIPSLCMALGERIQSCACHCSCVSRPAVQVDTSDLAIDLDDDDDSDGMLIADVK